jgi:hypothetical protein
VLRAEVGNMKSESSGNWRKQRRAFLEGCCKKLITQKKLEEELQVEVSNFLSENAQGQ